MSMSAARLALHPTIVADFPPSPAISDPGEHAPGCDFGGDGRLVGAIADTRSAWTCPIFYLAIPAYAVLAFAAMTIRLCELASAMLNRPTS